MNPGGPFEIAVCVRPPTDQPPQDGRVLGALDLRAVDYAVGCSRRLDRAVHVTALSVGGDSAATALRECLAMGVSEAVHVQADEPPLDGILVATQLAAVLADLRPDLVICGTRSDGGMHGAVPHALARMLEVPFAGDVVELELQLGGPVASVRAVQRLERGDRWAWGCDLPMVCAVERDLCVPRYLAIRRLQRTESALYAIRQLHGDVGVAATADLGSLVVESRHRPRIRPKKTKAPTATMSPAERMKLLRGGSGRGAAGAADSDDRPRRVSGDPDQSAAEIVKLLDQRELL